MLYGISGQGRLDGAFCDFTEKEKMDYLKRIHKEGVKNIEMESLSFAALTHHAGIKSAVVCVTIVDRLKGDQVGTFVITTHYDSITIDYRPGYHLSNACEEKKNSFCLFNHKTTCHNSSQSKSVISYHKHVQ